MATDQSDGKQSLCCALSCLPPWRTCGACGGNAPMSAGPSAEKIAATCTPALARTSQFFLKTSLAGPSVQRPHAIWSLRQLQLPCLLATRRRSVWDTLAAPASHSHVRPSAGNHATTSLPSVAHAWRVCHVAGACSSMACSRRWNLFATPQRSETVTKWLTVVCAHGPGIPTQGARTHRGRYPCSKRDSGITNTEPLDWSTGALVGHSV